MRELIARAVRREVRARQAQRLPHARPRARRRRTRRSGRPRCARTPERCKEALTDDQLKLYTLIWNKFVASQMTPARATSPRRPSSTATRRFVAQGEVELFDGHLRVFGGRRATAEPRTRRAEEQCQELPPLEVGRGYRPQTHRADAALHAAAAALLGGDAGQGAREEGHRPASTYATIISTIQDRGYVTLEQRRFHATELGEIVTDQLVEHFADMINTDFTVEHGGGARPDRERRSATGARSCRASTRSSRATSSAPRRR